MTVLVVAEAVVIVLLAVLVVGMLRSHAEILRRLHELGAGDDAVPRFQTAPGTVAPDVGRANLSGTVAADIAGTTPAGGAAAIRVRRPGTRTLLAFMSATCPTCDNFWPRFGEEAAIASLGGIRLVIVAKSPEEESPDALQRRSTPDVPLVMSSQAWEDYRIPGSPYFVLVDGATGQVTGEGSAPTWEQLLDLMGIAAGDTAVGTAFGERDRAERVDQELADAGILPGDPRLYGENELPTDETR